MFRFLGLVRDEIDVSVPSRVIRSLDRGIVGSCCLALSRVDNLRICWQHEHSEMMFSCSREESSKPCGQYRKNNFAYSYDQEEPFTGRNPELFGISCRLTRILSLQFTHVGLLQIPLHINHLTLLPSVFDPTQNHTKVSGLPRQLIRAQDDKDNCS